MNKLRKCKINFLICSMAGMNEASLKLSFTILVYFPEQFFFSMMFFSFTLFVKTNRGRSVLWVVMFLILHLFCLHICLNIDLTGFKLLL